METVLKAIADWIKGILTAGIMSNLSGLFDDVNTQVSNIAQQVGTKPSSFEPRVFAMIEALSRNVVLPIAGIILTFIACYELIEMITQHNNMAQFEPALIMRWIFKTAVSVWLISNTFDIVMAVFDITQKVVSDSSGIIAGNTRVNDIGLSMLQYTSVKGARQKRFIRLKTLGAGYSEDEIKAVIAGKAEHRPHQKQPPKEQPFQLLVDIQAKLAEGKGGGYERWAKKHNLKEMSKTLLFLQEQKISSADELKELADAALSHYHELGDSIKAAEQRMTEIAVLRAHIVNYAKTRPVYDAYRKSGYSSKFLEAHREEITLHKTAKAAFNESGLKKLPKVKDLNAEYSALLTMKKALYPEYRKARDEMQEIVKAQKNVELFFAEEKDSKQVEQIR